MILYSKNFLLSILIFGLAGQANAIESSLICRKTSKLVPFDCKMPFYVNTLREGDSNTVKGQISFWTQFSAPTGSTFHHLWFKENVLMAKVPIVVKGKLVRGISRKKMFRLFSVGSWRVELRNDKDTIVAISNFTVEATKDGKLKISPEPPQQTQPPLAKSEPSAIKQIAPMISSEPISTSINEVVSTIELATTALVQKSTSYTVSPAVNIIPKFSTFYINNNFIGTRLDFQLNKTINGHVSPIFILEEFYRISLQKNWFLQPDAGLGAAINESGKNGAFLTLGIDAGFMFSNKEERWYHNLHLNYIFCGYHHLDSGNPTEQLTAGVGIHF